MTTNAFIVSGVIRHWNDVPKKSHSTHERACPENIDNYVAGIRTIIFVSYMVTNAFIVSGVIRHWNNIYSSSCVNGIYITF